MVYFRTGLHVDIIPNEQISRYLHERFVRIILSQIQQDVLNILIGKTGEPVICDNMKYVQSNAWQMVNGRIFF